MLQFKVSLGLVWLVYRSAGLLLGGSQGAEAEFTVRQHG